MMRRRTPRLAFVASVTALCMAFAGVAMAAEIATTAEVDSATVTEVTVEQGESANFNIRLGASGAIKCTATSSNPATAKVHTSFSLNDTGSLTSGTFSSAFNFFAGSAINTNNCNVTWTDAPTKYSVAASVSAHEDTPVGEYSIVLSTAAGTTETTTPSGGGGSLDDNTATTITVNVVAPSTPPDTLAPVVTIASVSGTGSTPSDTTSPFSVYTKNGTSIVWSADEAGNYAIKLGTDCTTGTALTGVANGTNLSGAYTSGNVTSSITNVGLGADGSKDVLVCVTDGANNTGSAAAAVFKDTVAPVITNNGPTPSLPDGSNDWYITAVSNAFSASDGSGSGLDTTCAGAFPKNVSTGTAEGSAVSVTSGACSDNAGNTNSGISSASFKIDLTNPTVQCDSPAPSFLLNQSPANVTATVSDGGSGAVNPATAAANTTTVGGSKSVSVTGYDEAGRSASVNCSYSVAYQFVGFERPVDNNGVLNKAKAGQAIPLKWRLLDANGTPVTNLSSVQVTVVTLNCGLGITIDAVEEYAAGGSGLQNLGNGYYQFNWKTPTTYANSCKTMNLDLGEGSPRTALFQFTK